MVTPEQLEVMLPVVLLADARNPSAWIDAVNAGALAGALPYIQEKVTTGSGSELWDHWMEVGSTRRILRANPSDFRSLTERYSDVEHVLIECGRAAALCLWPQSGRLPRDLRRLEECRAIFPDRASEDLLPPHPGTAPLVVLNSAQNELAGTAVGHAAEALLSWFLTLTSAHQTSWYDTGCPFTVISLAPTAFGNLLPYGAVKESVVHEALEPVSFILPPSIAPQARPR